MKKFCLFCLIAAISAPAFGVQRVPASARNSGGINAPSRQVASTGQLSLASMTVTKIVNEPKKPDDNGKSDDKVEPKPQPQPQPVPQPDKREKEKLACMSNNIGVGNTFVWASRYSNTDNYASMVEDIENPENNICFVRVELASEDSRISVSDFPGKYFEMGRNIECGSWVDASKLEQRILDAKKKARTLGTIAGAVAGAGVGVGAMELVGNKLIGGAVQGQKGMNESDLLRSQLLVLKKDNPSEYKKYVRLAEELQEKCEASIWEGTTKPSVCDDVDYELILATKSSK